MKKIIIAASALALVSSCAVMTASAEESTSCKAYVTVTLGDGNIASVQKEVNVTDIDSDGKLTINDALYIFHEENYEGGAAAGYKSSTGQYGLQLDKLYGVENGGSYGYYVDNKAANGLADEITDGAYINAFVYSDTATWSDKYSWFDKFNFEAECGASVELTLNHVDFDANWSPISVPVAGATILVNGSPTEFVTDDNGKVTVVIDNPGRNEISAKTDKLTLVPPVCVANVTGAASVTSNTTTTTTTTTTTVTSTSTAASSSAAGGDNSPKTGVAGVGTAAAVLAVSVGAAFVLRKRNED